ncbi:MAG: hydroxyacid dehydrogenase [Longimicrobiales bacterium]|nr:hydroxyacid dehydrogenase [Longimicrobiales bacterium]
MKIVVFETEPWERPTFDTVADEEGHQLVFVDGPLTEENAPEHGDAEVVSTFIYSELGADVLAELPHLRMISTRSTGFDHIDGEYCREHDIVVSNVPVYGANTVAEHVFALLLALSHHIVDAVDRTRRGDFSLQGLRGFDLQGKTLGIVGTGDIGLHTIRIARGFRMEVVAYDVDPKPELAEELGFRYASLDDVLKESDVLSLHVPLNESTRHMIGDGEFARMKDGAVLINTARGDVVDVDALVRALHEGKVAAAGLDVLPMEPVIREEAELLRSIFHEKHDLETLLMDHILLRLRNVIITPHSAFDTREAVQRILDTTVENIEAFLDGRPQNVVLGPGAEPEASGGRA